MGNGTDPSTTRRYICCEQVKVGSRMTCAKGLINEPTMKKTLTPQMKKILTQENILREKDFFRFKTLQDRDFNNSRYSVIESTEFCSKFHNKSEPGLDNF